MSDIYTAITYVIERIDMLQSSINSFMELQLKNEEITKLKKEIDAVAEAYLKDMRADGQQTEAAMDFKIRYPNIHNTLKNLFKELL
jgi:hypothetical protein